MNIVIDSLYKTFGATSALENINLQFRGGEFITVLGASGCGKTTLLHLLAGLTSPTKGNIYIDGEIKDQPGADRVVVFQQAGLFPWLSVEENIEFGPSLHGVPKAQRHKESADILRIIGLESFARHKPYELSGGMQQRVAIARALVMKPKVLLMDEPFGALDAQTRSSMQTFLTALWEQLHCTVVFITHDIDEAIFLGTRLVVLSARPGRVALDVPIELDRPRTPEVAFESHFLDLKKRAMGILAH
ncbi:ABC transporter ATP-binding protein [Paraburkholderia guartelaensis]|uniref:ABC transporter ATP-binding protein n=1 Tax=Paraburkholderia guartelaensis TaxID=2546446 RepID=A0A4R5LAB4_9BURK|nr:ABC transporter ATP-binding protein [Paraburkholderia guartelaensis]TDG06050.1 ABC transporter ATP-binding protein [Paraburkholderia guartelaensis]